MFDGIRSCWDSTGNAFCRKPITGQLKLKRKSFTGKPVLSNRFATSRASLSRLGKVVDRARLEEGIRSYFPPRERVNDTQDDTADEDTEVESEAIQVCAVK